MLARLGMPMERLTATAMLADTPFSTPTWRDLDADAGVVDLPAVTGALRHVLAERGVRIHEGDETTGDRARR